MQQTISKQELNLIHGGNQCECVNRVGIRSAVPGNHNAHDSVNACIVHCCNIELAGGWEYDMSYPEEQELRGVCPVEKKDQVVPNVFVGNNVIVLDFSKNHGWG